VQTTDEAVVNELMMWLTGGSAQMEAKCQPEVKGGWEE